MRGKEAEINLDWPLAEDHKAGNPPSFMFVLNYLTAVAIEEKDDRITNVLRNLEPRIQLWFEWFNSTLANTEQPNLEGTFMWRDVYSGGALSSGLDDYPRGYRES